MNKRQFDSSIRTLVGSVVEPWGFSCAGGHGSTFYREVNHELFHFIHFELRANQQEFEVWIFPGTPRLGTDQWAGFPDAVGVPTGRAAGLNAKVGVGGGASRFPCKDQRILEGAMSRVVLPAMEAHAETYLKQFTSVADIVPVLEHQQWAKLLSNI